MTKRAVLYARTNDVHKRSLARQLRTCREYARHRGWQILAELADQGINGMSDTVPQLARALETAQAGEFDVLVVDEIDRLSRDLSKLSALIEELGQAGVRVRCALGGCDHTDVRGADAEPAKEVIVYARVSGPCNCEDQPGPIKQRQIAWEHALVHCQSASCSLDQAGRQRAADRDGLH